MDLAGNFFLLSAFAFTLLTLFFLNKKSLHRQPVYEKAIFYFHVVVFLCIGLSLLSLLYLLLNGIMNVEYVASFTSHELSPIYKLSALWAGQSGSLLLWSFLLITFNTVFWLRYRKNHPEWQKNVSTVVMLTQLFFLGLNIWVVNPFKVLMMDSPEGLVPFTPSDGHGLNPLLHHPAMIIHPPILFIGYIGSVIPFALSITALWLNDFETMIGTLRRWVIFSWLFLTAGIGLGSWWAYAELGWGGYWAWDPVENASLMPWLIATALMHTLLIQRKQNMFIRINLILSVGFYFFCILGTFITRSGLINSVHAFSQSHVGFYFLAFLMIIVLSFTGLYFKKHSVFPDRKRVSSFLSEDSFALLLTITFIILTLAVLLGTLYPTLAEGLSGKVIMLDASYYNRLTRFITIIILILMMSSEIFQLLRNNKIKPSAFILFCSLTLVLTVMMVYIFSHDLVISLFSGLILLNILIPITRLLMQDNLITPEKQISVIVRQKRSFVSRAGSLITHLGFLLICFGIMGSIKNDSAVLDGKKGQSFEYRNYRFTVMDFDLEKNRLYESLTGHLRMTKHNGSEHDFKPQFRYYYANQQTSSEAAIESDLFTDIYIVLSHYDNSTDTGRFQIFINPLVTWIWIGCILLIAGSVISLFKK